MARAADSHVQAAIFHADKAEEYLEKMQRGMIPVTPHPVRSAAAQAHATLAIAYIEIGKQVA